MFAVIEERDSQKSLIHLVNSQQEFSQFIKKCIEDPNYKIIQKISAEEIKNKTDIEDGRYLIEDENNITYWEKTTIVNKGYIYNSKTSTVKLLTSWEMMANKLSISNIVNKLNKLDVKDKTFEKNEKKDLSDYFSNNELDVKKIAKNSTVCIIGKKSDDKTKLIIDILEDKDEKFISNTLIIASNRVSLNTYKIRFPKARIISEYSSSLVSDYLQRDEGAVVLDDCLLNNARQMRDSSLKKLFFNSRHHKKLFIISLQFHVGLAPEYRNQLDYVFLMPEENENIKKKFYEYYGTIFPSFDIFSKVFEYLTKTFGCIGIKQSVDQCNVFDRIFYYRTSAN